MIPAERVVALEGAPNFRDLGGYRTNDGRRVRWGRIYRSGALAALTPGDQTIVRSLGIASVLDLRSHAEVDAAPDPDLGATWVHLPVLDAALDVEVLTAALSAGDLDAIGDGMLVTGTSRIATDFSEQWRSVLEHVSSSPGYTTLIHCTGGKDRTGWASALLLRALGVPSDVVMEDYLLSNECLAARIAEHSAAVRSIVAEKGGVAENDVDLGGLPGLLGVRTEYLRAAFDAIDSRHGSFDTYLEVDLGWRADRIARLREELLE